MMKQYILQLLIVLSFYSSLNAQTVYKTPSGAKYHLASCHTVKNVSEALTIEQALKAGLAACKICKPGVGKEALTSTKKAAGQSSATVQCKGLTKAGNRCKHNTSIGNGFCFQHQPKE